MSTGHFRPAHAAELTSYVGRERETVEARRLLSASRLVTLTGSGGVGKTRLALRVMREVADDFADGAVFVPLAELGEPALLTNTVGAELGLPEPTEQTVLDHLRSRNLLMVLDNCEHLIAACAKFVHLIVTSTEKVTLLATSRQSLDSAGERVMTVPGLSVPADDIGISPENVGGYDAVRLFVDRAREVWPSFQLTAENTAAVVRLNRQLEGVPLAIELAAARIRALSPEQIAERLQQHPVGLLAAKTGAVVERQQSLRATIDWSYALCSPGEQSLWARVSVFVGSFDLPTAEHVCAGNGIDAADILDLVDGLVGKSVLIRVEQADRVRYRLLETLREYGIERLEQAGELVRLQRRHQGWLAELADSFAADWVGPDQVAWVRRLRGEHANLRAAMMFCLQQPDTANLALRMTWQLRDYFAVRGFDTELGIWINRALAAAPPDAPDRVPGLAVSAIFAAVHNKPDVAAYLVDQVCRLATRRGDDLSGAWAAWARTIFAVIQNDAAGVVPDATEAAEVFGRHGLLGPRLTMLGSAASATIMSDPTAGRAGLAEIIEFCAQRHEYYQRSAALMLLARANVVLGDLADAERAAIDGLEAAAKLDNAFFGSLCLETLAWLASVTDRHERAALLLGAGESMYSDEGSLARHGRLDATWHRKGTDRARKALGEATFENALRRGRELPLAVAIHYAVHDELPRESTDAQNSLTKREVEIADLVAEGLTNRDIAARLTISIRTVDTHVNRILHKLGLANRASLAAWVADRRTSS
ncbi:non-specific serine/threonine protein kinase [Herbihabitans rhizosphaerae]|uniref:Non-specific serine/threonine protein kinase n=1 Tax=Herbihabitans rhizosphaerae TaxID=1872711 RepID=A0A4Q7L0R9_9PSEU|nr:LuxR C-terminal-related transcriptional regulator [Herbihabitans rhizosphaerae]RZS43059.1 non-specific serine/threonine protein kinase [Herbihabitans rhizosphaerae]